MFPTKVLDLDDLVKYVADKHGGFWSVCDPYIKSGNRIVALPPCGACGCLTFRTSWIKEAGFEKVPGDLPGFLKLMQGLKKTGHPGGFALGHATGDANAWCHWVVWAHGGKMVDENDHVVINSPETEAALNYAKEMYETFVPGVTAWNDVSNNKSFLAGELSMTDNGISIYVSARKDKLPFADDIDHAAYPVGPIGRPTESQGVWPMFVFKYAKFPNAAKAFIAYLLEKPQFDAWLQDSAAYLTPCVKAYEHHPVFDEDPRRKPFGTAMERAVPISWAGTLGAQAAGVLADWVMVDMVADATAGGMAPKAAMEKAEKRARRFYKS